MPIVKGYDVEVGRLTVGNDRVVWLRAAACFIKAGSTLKKSFTGSIYLFP